MVSSTLLDQEVQEELNRADTDMNQIEPGDKKDLESGSLVHVKYTCEMYTDSVKEALTKERDSGQVDLIRYDNEEASISCSGFSGEGAKVEDIDSGINGLGQEKNSPSSSALHIGVRDAVLWEGIADAKQKFETACCHIEGTLIE